MAVALETFVKQLTDSGVIAPGELANFVPPVAQPKDAQELAKHLIASKRLTKFQVQEVAQGRAKSLILGNYTLLDKIGAGGMGQVFKAVHRRMERNVAIKMLPPAMTKDPMSLARFQREVKAAAKLRHTNIVAADDADDANGVHFLVMEYVEGHDLSVVVKKNGPLPVAKAVGYVLQAARGLEYAHQHGVVHRDIKPANLLLSKEGTIKILDMGLARIEQADGPAQAELTGTGTIMGTVDYMAPEQGMSTKHADARADIYSLGCTLYYLLTGKATYDGETVAAKLVAHHTQPIPDLRKAQPDVSEQLEAVFKMMVAKRVEDRYQKMTQVIAALEQCGADQLSASNLQPASTTDATEGTLAFLKEATAPAPHKPAPQKKVALAKPGRPNKRLIVSAAAGGILGLVILAAVIFSLRTKDGTLIVKINQPDAAVQVLNDEGQVEIRQPGGKGPLTIAVDPGKHRLKVEKDGFRFFTQDFTMESGGEVSIQAMLVPLAVATSPAKETRHSATDPDRRAAEYALSVGATVRVNWQVQDIKAAANLPREPFRLTWVSFLRNPQVNDAGLANFDDCTNLTDLDLAFTSVTDAGLAHFNRCKDLTSITIPGTAVTDAGLANFQDFKNLRLLQVSTHITDAGLGYLKECQNVETLNLDGCRAITDVGLSGLKNRKKLDDFLGLAQTQVTDAGLAHLKSCENLRRLDLRDTQVSDAGLVHVAAMGKLTQLKLANTKVTAKGIAGLAKALPNCQIERDDPAKASKSWESPAFQQWVKDVQALAAEKQVEAVSKRLVELNPGFDGNLNGVGEWPPPKIENGVVTGLGVVTDNVTDLSPFRALAGLRTLYASANTPGGHALSDLSSLEGMQLTTLHVSRTRVSDLTPLRGMPLTSLHCSRTPISDLSPLAAMPLHELSIHDTQVTDLSPLHAAKLESLICYKTGVFDLSPLQGMPLKMLDVSDTPVSDLSPLRGMPLAIFYCPDSQVSDLSPLAQMSLREINFSPQKISRGIAVIRGMKSIERIAVKWQGQSYTTAEFWKKYDAGEFDKPAAPAAEAGKPVDLLKLVDLKRDVCKGEWRFRDSVLVAASGAILNIPYVPPPNYQITLTATRIGLPEALVIGLPIGNQWTNADVDSQAKFSGFGQVDGRFLDEQGLRAQDQPYFKEGIPTTVVYTVRNAEAEIQVNGRLISHVLPASKLSLWADYSKHNPAPLFVATWSAFEIARLELLPLDPSKPGQRTFAGSITTFKTPVFQQWMKTVAALPAEQQVAAVAKKLQDLNPGFDGKVTPKIENGAVAVLSFGADNVTDLSPVRALSGLRALNCAGSNAGASRLSDLSPLKGMSLSMLSCNYTQVADLSPLQGMPIAGLVCYWSKVADLSPLRGMPLEMLYGGFTPVSDLSPLEDCKKLKSLHIAGIKATPAAVAALQKALPACTIEWPSAGKTYGQPAPPVTPGKPTTTFNDPIFQAWMKTVAALPADKQVEAVAKKLVELNPGFAGQVAGAYVKGPGDASKPKIENGVVTEIGFAADQVTDISPLRVLTGLRALTCAGSSYPKSAELSDLSPLKGMPLAKLNCSNTQVSDLSPLAGMPLTWFACGATNVSDLAPLKGMQLTLLYCSTTQVADLSPLAAMPLHELSIHDTQVTDLSPLRGAKLESLNCYKTGVSDLSPLQRMPLKALDVRDSPNVADLSPLEQCKLLISLNVKETKASAAGVAALQKALPNCKINWDDPAKGKTP